jgi:hypothetical protein
MNYRLRKKPVVVEAFQMTEDRRKDNLDWPQWLHEAWNKEIGEVGCLCSENYPKSDGDDRLLIGTLWGLLLISWGDFIVCGVHGELSPCKPTIFWATYEEEVEGHG